MPLGAIVLLSLGINLPLGYLRSRVRRFSWRWFVWVHLSIPVIATCRIVSGFGLAVVPVLISAAVVGQLAGGKMGAS